MRHDPLIYVYSNFINRSVQYLPVIWLSIKDDLPILTDRLTPLPTVHSYTCIYVSHVTIAYSHWLLSWGTCIIYTNFIH